MEDQQRQKKARSLVWKTNKGKKMYRLINLFPLIITPFLVVTTKNGCTKQKEVNEIVWNEDYKLKWSDFQGDSITGIHVVAVSSLNIKLDYRVRTNLDWFKVACIFYKKKSPVKAKYQTEEILNHEQGHFDIGEIYARELRKRIISKRSTINRVNYRLLDSMYFQTKKEFDFLQTVYDIETGKSVNSVKQTEWDSLISTRLKELRKYSKNEY